MKEDLKVIGNFERFLCLVFLILKTTGTVNWSWWLVFLPLYFLPALLVIILLFIGICLAIVAIKERMFCSK
jgi:hypothetical protein